MAAPAATKFLIFDFFWSLVAAGAAVNHPCRGYTTRLGAEVGSAIAAGVIRGSPRREFICRIQCLVEAGLLQITPAAPPLPTLAPWW
jgi:hypothetical protein